MIEVLFFDALWSQELNFDSVRILHVEASGRFYLRRRATFPQDPSDGGSVEVIHAEANVIHVANRRLPRGWSTNPAQLSPPHLRVP